MITEFFPIPFAVPIYFAQKFRIAHIAIRITFQIHLI